MRSGKDWNNKIINVFLRYSTVCFHSIEVWETFYHDNGPSVKIF